MSIERIIERQIGRDEAKWDAEATAAIDAEPDYKAYLMSLPAEPRMGPMTPEDKTMWNVRKRIQDRLADKMKSHYIDSIPATTPMVHDIAVEALDDFGWQGSAEGFLDVAIDKLPAAAVA